MSLHITLRAAYFRLRESLATRLRARRWAYHAAFKREEFLRALSGVQEALTALEAAREIGEDLDRLAQVSAAQLYIEAEIELAETEARLREFLEYGEPAPAINYRKHALEDSVPKVMAHEQFMAYVQSDGDGGGYPHLPDAPGPRLDS